MHDHSPQLIAEIGRTAQQWRLQVLEMVFTAQTGHIGGSFSAAEIVAALYMHHLRIDPANPAWPERDRFLLSKGHAVPILYCALAERGFIGKHELSRLRQFDSRLPGHPEPATTPGIELTAGPLGHGLAVGAGMAAAAVLDKRSYRTYVLMGDGEINAGGVWEAAMFAAKYRLDHLTAILDYNGVQQTGTTADVMPTEPIADKWQAFGWHVIEVHAHNVHQVLDALDLVADVHARPTIIIARGTKGKGVSFMEYNNIWHGKPPNEQEYASARLELERGLAEWQH
jgi:transketolase